MFITTSSRSTLLTTDKISLTTKQGLKIQIDLRFWLVVALFLFSFFSVNAMAQISCGKAPNAPKWMSGSSKSLQANNQKAASTFLKKADRYLRCQDRVSRSTLKQLSPRQKRARLNELSRISQSRNALKRKLNRSLAKQRTKNPF